MSRTLRILPFALLLGTALWLRAPSAAAARRPLASWKAPYRTTILKHISAVTTAGSADFIPVTDRIAAFDLDGTLITERPDYFHGFISKQWLKLRVAADPKLSELPVYKAVLSEDKVFLRKNLTEWLLESFAGETLEQIHAFSLKHFAQTPTVKGGKPFAALWYLPMVELIEHLKSRGFRVYVVSTAQQEIIRAVIAHYLKLDPANVLGSMAAFEPRGRGKKISDLVRVKKAWTPFCHGKGKVLRFRERVGRAPVFAAGNSTNDIALLYYAASTKYRSMNLVLDHDDPREHIYAKSQMLALAKKEGWQVVSMKKAFTTLYGPLDFVRPACADSTSAGEVTPGPQRTLLFAGSIAGMVLLLLGAVLLVRLRRGPAPR